VDAIAIAVTERLRALAGRLVRRDFVGPALAAGFAVACAMGCASTEERAPVAHVAVSEPEKVTVDVSGLHPAASSRTVGDARALAPGVLKIVSLERNALTGTDGVEPWLARVLFAWLVEHGAEVREAAAVQAEGARLVGVRFAAQREEASVAVGDNEGGGVLVRYWAGKGDESLCPPAMKVPLTSVQLEGALLDAGGRAIASFAEVVVAQPPAMRVELEVESDRCATITDAFTDEFVPSETELVSAARAALETGFASIVGRP
jgi:hypothetical protein